MNNHEYMRENIFDQFKKHKTAYLFLGISFVLFGTLAILFSMTSTIASILYLAILLVIFGGFEVIKAFKNTKTNLFFLHLLIGILAVVAGIFMLMNPVVNAMTLTLLLAIFFMFSGALRIFFALFNQFPHRIWVLINGVITFLLGLLIYLQWPWSGLWVIGTLIGIDAIFTGWSWIMLSLAVNHRSK